MDSDLTCGRSANAADTMNLRRRMLFVRCQPVGVWDGRYEVQSGTTCIMLYAAREPDKREAGLSLSYVPLSQGPDTYSRG